MSPVFKQTILRPILKKVDSDPTDPANYRPISLLNTLMKLYEALIKTRLVNWLESESHISPVQAAYRKGHSTCDHILVIQELFLEYRFNKRGPRGGKCPKALYFCFLDLRKAFDTVPRDLLFKKLYTLGIKGKMLRVIWDLYTGNTARVQVQNFLSKKFQIHRGVLQGSKLGPILFNIFINDLLKDLHDSSLGAQVAGLIISTLGFADDIILIADRPDHLQRLISKCQTWASKNRMSFSLDKCKVMVFNRKPEGLHFYMAGEELEIVNQYKYLGILLSSSRPQNTLYREHFTRVKEKAERRIQCIKHLGYHQDGLRPQTAIRMYKILVRPLLEYGAQVITYRRHFLNSIRPPVSIDEATFFMKDIERLQTKALKSLLQCPRNVSPSIVRLFAGVEPMACRIEMLKLRYYWRIIHSSKNICKKIVSHRKRTILEFNVGFTMEIFKLCCKIGHISFWHGIHRGNANLSMALNPLNSIKKAVTTYYLNKDLSIARSKDCLFRTLYLQDHGLYKNHYFLVKPFTTSGTFLNSSSRQKFIKVLLSSNRYLESCCFCSLTFYDLLLHQITSCPYLIPQRKILSNKLLLYGYPSEHLPPQIRDLPRLLAYAILDKNLLRAITEFLEYINY